MSGVVIERNTTLLPLSLVLKEMNMITATYEGSPAEPVSGSTLLPTIALRRRGGEHPELPGEGSYRRKGSVYEAHMTSDDARR
jgi:hypothetical protein